MNVDTCRKCKFVKMDKDAYGTTFKCLYVPDALNPSHGMKTNFSIGKEFKPRLYSKKRLVIYQRDFAPPIGCPYILEHTLDQGNKWIN